MTPEDWAAKQRALRPLDPTFYQGHPLLGMWCSANANTFGHWVETATLIEAFGYKWVPWWDVTEGMRAICR
jgi:uncharacterized protein involved in copper resistance